MANYLDLESARTLTKLSVVKVPDAKLELLAEGATKMIDNYIGKHLVDDEVDALVKITCVNLITYLSKDRTYSFEQLDDYSYKLNENAVIQILSRLKDYRTDEKKQEDTLTRNGIVRGGYV